MEKLIKGRIIDTEDGMEYDGSMLVSNNDGSINIILEYNGKRISYNKCFIQVNPSMPTMNGHEEVLPDECFEIKIVCDYKIMI